ncbi:hypothetical protein [Streptomyces sp. NBC_00094]|uniref:hypothetical protein n=1 Tax=Streptomyces sp. NBC_00094 TaxID=2903620 RepID=UPI0022594488|nr:hypothetical protein [Streptomyces sp. NBC_00094]MCX5393997.1 hypothetical protein [Streptomyces sp. NBC_00094]
MLSLQTAAAVAAPPARQHEWDPRQLAYYRDLYRQYDIDIDTDDLTADGVTHTDLLDLLHSRLSDTAPPVDLIICAQALPDRVSSVQPASYLNALYGNRANSFAVAGQGLASPFTALRIAEAYTHSHPGLTVAVAILEQTTLPVRLRLVRERELTDSGVLLVLKDGGDLSLRTLLPADRAAHVRQRLDAIARLPGRRRLLVTGATAVPGRSHGYDVHRARRDAYCTAVWAELAAHRRDWHDRYDHIVLLDTDPQTGESSLAHFAPRCDERDA